MDQHQKLRVGWVGTGVMGGPMAGHVLAAGYPVAVTTRTRQRAAHLEAAGAAWADTPADVAAASDVTFTMVGFPAEVREVVLGPSGTLAGSAAGAVLVDMSSSEPSLAVEIHAAAEAKHVGSVDAPVSGGDVGARNATLSIMVGGTDDAVARVRPLLEVLGQSVVHQGGPGAGQHTKMVNQMLIATGMVGMCEALLYAYRAGLDPARVLESVSGGAAGSWSLSNLAPRVLRGDFGPGFYVEHFVKDMGIALEEAARMHLAVPGLALAHQLYEGLVAQGGARLGTQALVLALARLSGGGWPEEPASG